MVPRPAATAMREFGEAMRLLDKAVVAEKRPRLLSKRAYEKAIDPQAQVRRCCGTPVLAAMGCALACKGPGAACGRSFGAKPFATELPRVCLEPRQTR